MVGWWVSARHPSKTEPGDRARRSARLVWPLAHTRTHRHTRAHTHAHTDTHTHTQTHTRTHTHTHTHTHTRTRISAQMFWRSGTVWRFPRKFLGFRTWSTRGTSIRWRCVCACARARVCVCVHAHAHERALQHARVCIRVCVLDITSGQNPVGLSGGGQ